MKKIIVKTLNPKGKRVVSISRNFSVSPLPRIVRIEPSSLCNLRCIHCPTGMKSEIKRGNMPNEIFSRIIEELKTYKGIDVTVLYHAGEPFLNETLFGMIRNLKSIGIRFIKTNTNGMLITDKMLSQIIESGLDNIEFSLDGLSPEENNYIRRESDYHQVASVIKKLLRRKESLGSKTPDVWITNTQIPFEKDISMGTTISTPEFILNDFVDFEGKISFKSGYMIKWPGFNPQPRFKLIEKAGTSNLNLARYCDHLMQTITFRWNGNVVPCCWDITESYIVGNIMTESLLKIWNNRKYQRLRKSIYSGKYLPLCSNCSFIKPQLLVVERKK